MPSADKHLYSDVSEQECKMGQPIWKKAMQLFNKLTHTLTICPSNPFLGCYKNMCVHEKPYMIVYSSPVHMHQNLEAIQMSISK